MAYQFMKWPPTSRFDLIPTALQPYIDLADEATTWLNFFSPAEVEERYEQYIDKLNGLLDSTMDAIASLEPDSDGAFEATLALFTVAVHQYRWKHVPVLQETRDIKSMTVPPCFKVPLLHLTGKVGLPFAGSVYALVVCNYDAASDGSRFMFNSILPGVMQTEKGWTKMLWTFEQKSAPFLEQLVELCTALDDDSIPDKEKVIAEHLAMTKRLAASVFRTLHEFDSKKIISSKYFALYIEGPHGWGIDGIGGASGAQMLPVTSLDAILSIKGESMMYRETIRSRSAMTTKMRDYLSFLDTHAPKLREHYAHLPEFVELVRMVYNFRLGHRKIGIRYLASSEGTAGGKIQLTETRDGHEMVDKFEREMGARIKENHDYIDQLIELYGPPPEDMNRLGRNASMPVLNSLELPELRHTRFKHTSDVALNLIGGVMSLIPSVSTISEMGRSLSSLIRSRSSTVVARDDTSAEESMTESDSEQEDVVPKQNDLVENARVAFSKLIIGGNLDSAAAQKLMQSYEALLQAATNHKTPATKYTHKIDKTERVPEIPTIVLEL
ncbi:uncharacterized protein SPPG_08784 [Spizellomyces punctatus DAOM BR117]|uniref:Indoleamine 2,3-dioxygenase n=1 Tax=Spizellomyces punctatus (strain DAOM BR117) TaxID=645134 RepID=A0A0L0H2W4_SPIPD|nr:uncharacterized protein SPPG_08784 [Spizellomyces punctatus DAOM BR117]KNC95790.1 hypothetical protein SPPG_08784 [Spizellomyces punctatus DAOM BR117]|eukprot:XP_016603830.1 hypothetical protein SPPG_08784 [Spizellomyces punctatus DAOM BR117]